MSLHRFIASPTSTLGETLSAAVLKPGCRCTSTQDMYMYVLYTERAGPVVSYYRCYTHLYMGIGFGFCSENPMGRIDAYIQRAAHWSMFKVSQLLSIVRGTYLHVCMYSRVQCMYFLLCACMLAYSLPATEAFRVLCEEPGNRVGV